MVWRPGDSRSSPATTATGHRGSLFNLDTDIGETANVTKQHPDVVRRLLGYVKQMDADLGVSSEGPGCRAPGKIVAPNRS